MKARKTFRQWAEQWPQESRWILWIWAICLAGLLVASWAGVQKWRRARAWERAAAAEGAALAAPVAPATAQSPAWVVRARRVDLDFPAEPEVWVIAARMLAVVDPEVARRLLRDATELLPDITVVRADFPDPTPAGTPVEAEFARASTATVRGALDFSGWLMVQGRWQDAQSWLAGLPAGLKGRPELASRQAALQGALQQFAELGKSLADGVWGKVASDAVELAFASRLASQREQPALARDLWRVAIAAAGTGRESQTALLRLALRLGLRDQCVLSFDRVMSFPESARPTARQFAIWAHQQGNPVVWSRASQAWLELDPVAAGAYLAEQTKQRETRNSNP